MATKVVNFRRDAINKSFDNVRDLEDYMEEFAEYSDKAMSDLAKMHSFMKNEEESREDKIEVKLDPELRFVLKELIKEALDEYED